MVDRQKHYDADPDYRIEVRIKNNRILAAMERAGINTISELCRRAKLEKQQAHVGQIINMKKPPLRERGPKFRAAVERIAAAIHCEPDDLFNERQLVAGFNATTATRLANEADLSLDHLDQTLLTTDDPISNIHHKEMIAKLTKSLTPRELSVIKARHLGEGATLDELGDELGVGRERIRQIEAKAFRKMRRKAELLKQGI